MWRVAKDTYRLRKRTPPLRRLYTYTFCARVDALFIFRTTIINRGFFLSFSLFFSWHSSRVICIGRFCGKSFGSLPLWIDRIISYIVGFDFCLQTVISTRIRLDEKLFLMFQREKQQKHTRICGSIYSREFVYQYENSLATTHLSRSFHADKLSAIHICITHSNTVRPYLLNTCNNIIIIFSVNK